MARHIFISYRRADVGVELASRLAAHIKERVPDAEIFVDLESIGIGSFSPQLEAALASAHIVLAVIGKDWRGVSDSGTRLDEPADWVRREVQSALRADKVVVPVLVDAALPSLEELPLSLRPLAQYQAYAIEVARFAEGADRLAAALAAPDLAPTMRRRDAEEDAYRELTGLVARLQDLVLKDVLDLPALVAAARALRGSIGANTDGRIDEERRRVLLAAHSVATVFATIPRGAYQYAAFRPHGAVVDGDARIHVDSALRLGVADYYPFENAQRLLFAAHALIAAGVAGYASRYRSDGTEIAVPPATRFLVATRTRPGTGVVVFGTVDGRTFTRIGMYEARAHTLQRIQLRASRNQEPKLYAFDDRSVYRWNLGSPAPEVEWPIPDANLSCTFENLNVLQGERFEFLVTEGEGGRRWVKWVGRPELVEVSLGTPGTGGTVCDAALGAFGVATTRANELLVEDLTYDGALQRRELAISDALTMRPDLFEREGATVSVLPPYFVEASHYRGFRCVLADCGLSPAGDALLFLDADRGTWLRTPIVQRSPRGNARLIEVGARSYLVRATADGNAAALVWDVSDPVDTGSPPVIARWASSDAGSRTVIARDGSQILALCSSTTLDDVPGFAVVSFDEQPPRFIPVELDGATPELASAVGLSPVARADLAPRASQAPPPTEARKYKAFISYSHAADGALAPQLQSMLQGFAKPWYALRAFRVFRDKTGLGVTSELWPAIERALEHSEFFVLLASPQAAASRWVKREVEWWLQHRSPEHLLIVWTAGELRWRAEARDFDWNATTALPRVLEGVFANEPLYLDLRWAKREVDASPRRAELVDAVGRLASTLRAQPLEDLVGEDIRQHRKFRLFSGTAVAAVLVFGIVATWQAVVARREANVARAETKRADDEAAAKRAEAERAERGAATTRSLGLAAQSADAVSRDLGEALKLAVEARRAAATDEANIAILRSLAGPRLRWMIAHGQPIRGLDITHGEPRTLLSLTKDGVVRLWSVDDGHHIASFGKDIVAAAFSPDGSKIATADARGAIQIRERTSLGVIASMSAGVADEDAEDATHIAALVWSPDGNSLAGPDDYGWLNVCNVRTATRTGYFEVFGEFTARATFSPKNSRVLAFSGAWDAADVVDVATAKRVATVGIHDDGNNMWNGNGASIDGVTAAAFSPDGTQVLIGSERGRLELWNIGDKRPELVPCGVSNMVSAVAFTHEGFLAAGVDGIVRVWDSNGKPAAFMFGHTGAVTRARVSPSGGVLLTTSTDGTARLWDLETGSQIASLTGHGMDVTAAEFVDERHVITAGDDGTVRAWDLDNALSSASLGTERTARVGYSSDGTKLVAVRTGHLDVYDRLGRSASTLALPTATWKDAAVSPDVRRAAIVTENAIEIRDIDTRALVARVDGVHDVTGVAFAEDGATVLLAHARGVLTAVDARTGKEVSPGVVPDRAILESKPMHDAVRDQIEARREGNVYGIGPHGVKAVLERRDWVTVIADVGGQVPDVELPIPDHTSVWVTAFSPDGTRVAVAERGGRVRAFDTKDGRPVAVWSGSPSDVSEIEYSRDGTRVLMLDDHGSIRIADTKTGRQLAALDGLGSLTEAHFSPDGKQFVVGSEDEAPRIFTLDPDELAKAADRLLPVLIPLRGASGD